MVVVDLLDERRPHAGEGRLRAANLVEPANERREALGGVEIPSRFHGEELGNKALEEFNTRFSSRDLESADLPILTPSGARDFLSVVVEAFASCFQTSRSRSEARRLLEGGSVQWQGEKVTDAKASLPIGAEGVLKLDKTRAVRLKA